MKRVLCFIVFLSATPLFAQPVEPNEIQQLKTKIEQLEKTIAEQKLIIAKQNAKLNEQEKENKRLLGICQRNKIETNPEKTDKPLSRNSIAQSFTTPLKVGQIAYIGGENSLIAKQVVDENNVICEFIIKRGYKKKPNKGGPREGEELSPYMSATGLSTKTGPEQSETIWLANFDTTGLVDGKIVKCNRPLKISGTKTYDTADLGTATIFLLEPYQVR